MGSAGALAVPIGSLERADNRARFLVERRELYVGHGLAPSYAEQLAFSDLLALLGRLGPDAETAQLNFEDAIVRDELA